MIEIEELRRRLALLAFWRTMRIFFDPYWTELKRQGYATIDPVQMRAQITERGKALAERLEGRYIAR